LYARIVDFAVPDSAGTGETINASVKVRNEESLGAQVLLQVWDDVGDVIFHQEKWIYPYSEELFYVSFIMPDRDYTVEALTWFWTAPEWTFQDRVSTTIRLVERPYWLTLTADKTKGRVGDTFTFSGYLTQDGMPVADKTVHLYVDGTWAGSDLTDSSGGYEFKWTPLTPNMYKVHTEAIP